MFKSTAARKFFNLFNFSLSPNFVNTWCCLKLFRSSAARKFVNFIQSAYLSSLCWLPIKVVITANFSISVFSTILSTPDIVWLRNQQFCCFSLDVYLKRGTKFINTLVVAVCQQCSPQVCQLCISWQTCGLTFNVFFFNKLKLKVKPNRFEIKIMLTKLISSIPQFFSFSPNVLT